MPEHTITVGKIVVVRIIACSILFVFQVAAHQVSVKSSTTHKNEPALKGLCQGDFGDIWLTLF